MSRRFQEIRPGERDYGACFREWYLLERRDEAERVLLVTGADDHDATAAGLEKYEKRIAKLAGTIFRGLKGRPVVFEVRRRRESKGIDLVASAEPPEKHKRSGT